MSSELVDFPELFFPDGTYSEENKWYYRIFDPLETPHKIGDGRQRGAHRFTCHVVCCQRASTVHLKKRFVPQSVANPWPNHSAFGDMQPAAQFGGWRLYADLTSVVVETAAAQAYCHAGTPYRGAIAAWAVYHGGNNLFNQSSVLPHSYWALKRQGQNKSYCEGRIQSLERAERWAVLRALVSLARTTYATKDVVHWFRPRQVLISIHGWLINDILGDGEILKWRTPEGRSWHWPDGGARKPANYRSWGYMEHFVRIMEKMGIFVQFWYMEGRVDEVSGQAQAMANEALKKQEVYVQKLYGLLLSLCEHAAKELGYISDPQPTRKRKRAMLESV